MEIDEQAYQLAREQTRDRGYSFGEGCRRFLKAYLEAAKGSATTQPEERCAEKGTVAHEIGAARTGRNGESVSYNGTDRAAVPTGQPVELPAVDAHQLFEDITLAEAQLSKLCETGGRSWSLTIPVKHYDTDVVYGNMIRYAKALLAFLRRGASHVD